MPPARSFLSRFLPAKQPAQVSRAPEGAAIYAVGDIHGRADLLHTLLRKIAFDAAKQPPDVRSEILFLGDYVDRGPDSKGVIDLILSTRSETDFWSVTALKGNHESALLDFMRDPGLWEMWQEFGARETLLSYGVQPPPRGAEPEVWARASEAMRKAVPAEHVAFLEGLPLLAERGDYLMVHAGVRPTLPLDRQTEADLLWIRDDFLRNERHLGKVIVHGHTPADAAYLGHHRIGLDTGAYATGLLTAVKLQGAERILIQARPGE